MLLLFHQQEIRRTNRRLTGSRSANMKGDEWIKSISDATFTPPSLSPLGLRFKIPPRVASFRIVFEFSKPISKISIDRDRAFMHSRQPTSLKSESDHISRNGGWQNCRPPSATVNKFQGLKLRRVRDESRAEWWTPRRRAGNVHQHPLPWAEQDRSGLNRRWQTRGGHNVDAG